MSYKYEVALYEAETQLMALQANGVISCIIGYDSDFVTLGADHIMLDSAWRSGGGMVYIKSRVKQCATQLAKNGSGTMPSRLVTATCHGGILAVSVTIASKSTATLASGSQGTDHMLLFCCMTKASRNCTMSSALAFWC